MNVSLYKATKRKTQCHWLVIEHVRILFSYQTPIAVHDSKTFFRRHNDWGRTTGRHMRETSVNGWPEVTEEEFEARLSKLFVDSVVQPLVAKFTA